MLKQQIEQAKQYLDNKYSEDYYKIQLSTWEKYGSEFESREEFDTHFKTMLYFDTLPVMNHLKVMLEVLQETTNSRIQRDIEAIEKLMVEPEEVKQSEQILMH